MKTEEINIAIAEACGWTKIEDPTHYLWKRPNTEWRGGFEYATELPGYFNDLNAAIGLCDHLGKQGWRWVAMGVEEGVQFTVFREKHGIANGDQHEITSPTLAAAICETFLLTLNLWKE